MDKVASKSTKGSAKAVDGLESIAQDNELPSHSSKIKVVTSADGRRTNINFEEDNNYVDMEAGDLSSEGSDHNDQPDNQDRESDSGSSSSSSDEGEVSAPSQGVGWMQTLRIPVLDLPPQLRLP